jgi:hypothetical protein
MENAATPAALVLARSRIARRRDIFIHGSFVKTVLIALVLVELQRPVSFGF